MSFAVKRSFALLTTARPSLARFYTTEASATLLNRLKDDRKTYMRSKQQPDLNVVKSVLSEYTYYIKSPNAPSGHSEDAMVLSVLQKAIKKRQDSVTQYTAGGRPELAANEQQELAVLQRYLPEQMDAAEIEEKVRALVEQVGATSLKDMGKVMKAWTIDPAAADRKLVSDAVKKALS
ncbi:Yqey-like protein-domain-containing protein [Chlamydoabsidia padenii]|nr:Yqey-like protein-domain-containing protein [Chlamydoabsidia padenii]